MAGRLELWTGAVYCAVIVAWGATGPALAAPTASQTGLLGAPPVYREIKDWVIACDNTRACIARYVPEKEGEGELGYLSISRQGGAQGALVVEIQAIAEDDNGAPDPGTLRLDGRRLAGTSTWRVDARAQTASLAGDSARAFVRAMLDGGLLDYAHGEHGYEVGLSGLKAALLAMDEDQGRLDGVTALARPGARAATFVPAALPIPRLRAVPAAQLLPGAATFAARVRRSQIGALKTHFCEPSRAEGDAAWALDRDRAIVVLGCGMGAYQGWALAFVAPRTAPERARLLVLPEPPGLARDASPEYVGSYTEGEWDPKEATFSFGAKGRGLGDCGESGSWIWDGEAFRLSGYTNLNRCSGGPAGDWPTLYRTRVVIAPAA